MSAFNYSKWDKIELSDDESDCHPNIDKESWFRMKHRSRLEREEREDAEVKSMEQLNKQNEARLNIIRARLNAAKSGQLSEDAEFEDVDALAGEAEELGNEIKKRNKRIAEINERRAWNIDNICKITDEKTVVNAASAPSLKASDFQPTGHTEALHFKDDNKTTTTAPSTSTTSTTAAATAAVGSSAKAAGSTNGSTKSSSAAAPSSKPVAGPPTAPSDSTVRGKFAVISYNDYAVAHEAVLESYSDIRSMEESRDYLFKHCDILLHEHAQSYMLLSCLEDEMNGKHDRMKLVCRQSQILSHITELAVSLGRDPRDVILPFFRRIEEKEYLTNFLSAVQDFIVRIQKRSVEKRREMDAEARREAREEAKKQHQQHLQAEGSGAGATKLDPFEVLEMLPIELQEAFESQDIGRLHAVLGNMKPADAKHWMKLCVDSGLWVPSDASVFEEEGEEEHEENVEEDH